MLLIADVTSLMSWILCLYLQWLSGQPDRGMRSEGSPWWSENSEGWRFEAVAHSLRCGACTCPFESELKCIQSLTGRCAVQESLAGRNAAQLRALILCKRYFCRSNVVLFCSSHCYFQITCSVTWIDAGVVQEHPDMLEAVHRQLRSGLCWGFEPGTGLQRSPLHALVGIWKSFQYNGPLFLLLGFYAWLCSDYYVYAAGVYIYYKL